MTLLTTSHGLCGRTDAKGIIFMLKEGSLCSAFGMLMVNSGLQKGKNRSCVTERVAELLSLSNLVNPSEHSQMLESKKGVIAQEVLKSCFILGSLVRAVRRV